MSVRSEKNPAPVLFLATRLETGGAERQMTELVKRLDPARFRPIVVCQKGGGPFYDEIVEAGIEAHRLEVHGKLDPRFPWRLGSLAKRRGIRAMIIEGFSTGVVGRLVARSLGIRPVIMAEHTTVRIDLDPKKRPLERLLAPLADGVIAVARGQIPFLVEDKGFRKNQIRVIYNGIDVETWRPRPKSEEILREFGVPEGAPVVGILAMLRVEKDHSTFLRGARLVANEIPGTRFLVVGEGPERSKLERLASELGLAEHVIFTGRRTDIAPILSVFDVAVLTSVTEALPMSLLEAMAMARPLVCTAVGGIPEIIEEGTNGFLVPPENPEELAVALVKVLSSGDAAAMGRAARETAEHKFAVRQMVRATESFIESFWES